MSAELTHNSFGRVIRRFTDELIRITETEQQVGQDVNDVGLEETAQHGAELLKGKERTFSVSDVLLVLNGFRQRSHNVELFERQDAQAFNDTCDTVSRTFPITICVG